MSARISGDSRITLVFLVCFALLFAAFSPLCGSCFAEGGSMMACCEMPMTDISMKACHGMPADVTIRGLPCGMNVPPDLVMTIPDHSQSQKAHRAVVATTIPAGAASMNHAFAHRGMETLFVADDPVYLKNRILRI